MQIQEDISLYNAFRKRQRQGKERKSNLQSKLRPGESQTKKSKPTTVLVNATSAARTSTLSHSMAKGNTLKQLAEASDVEPPSGVAKHKKQDRIVVGLRYKTQPISHLTGFHSNAASDRFRGRSHYGTGMSTPVARSTTSHRPRVKKKSERGTYPTVMSHSSPESPLGSAPDSLFDVSR